MSDTGGGHRAAAEAIRDALVIRHGDEVQVELVDVFRHYSPFPFKYMPEFYPWWVNHSKSSWAMGYKLSNTKARARMVARSLYLSIEKGLKQMFREHPADVVVCVHSLFSQTAIRALNRTFDERPPFMIVVTDLVSTHMFWYDKHADRCLVPTKPALERGLEAGLRRDQMRLTGLPVNPGFTESLPTKAAARAELGWDPDLPAVLLVSGGEGMGPLYETARAINNMNLPCQIAVVAGRNRQLKADLEASTWHHPAHIYPFINFMPTLMAAADILVTKAGPATITEACIAGLPLILSDAIPGQETGNVEFIMKNKAGVYAPSPDAVAAAVKSFLSDGPAGLAKRSERVKKLALPNAVWDIADEVWEQAQRKRIPTQRRTLKDRFNDVTRGLSELTISGP
ncbi:MAG: galactosyldiacylglycerol synthase [Burkholderiales bacterium]|nr:galactosyldiacylglycerol synthase [Anaerolineae bacterium]